jgi:hypothetical protein
MIFVEFVLNSIVVEAENEAVELNGALMRARICA